MGIDWSELAKPSSWSPIVALAALILSQLPPAREFLKRRRLRMFTANRMAISHRIGSVRFVIHLNLQNIGGRDVTMSGIDCYLRQPNEKTSELHAQSYFPMGRPGAQNTNVEFNFIGWIPVKHGESWENAVVFYEPWSEDQEEEANNISRLIREDIIQKRNSYPKPEEAPTVEADSSLVEAATKIFNQRFNLRKGSYRMYIIARGNNQSILAAQALEFTLFESSIETLRDTTKDYKFGAGIYYDHPNPFLFVRVHEVDETTAKASLDSLRKSTH